jgi:hypothetical protein
MLLTRTSMSQAAFIGMALLVVLGCSGAGDSEPVDNGALDARPGPCEKHPEDPRCADAGGAGGSGSTGGSGGSAATGAGGSGSTGGSGGSAGGGAGGAGAQPSGFPGDLPEQKVIAYYDARSLSQGSGQAVTTWPDLSANGHDLGATSNCAPPKLSTAAFAGAKSVEFDGQTTCLKTLFGQSYPESYVYWAVIDLISLPGPSSAALWSVSPDDPAGINHKNMLGIDSPNTWVTKNMSTVGQAGHYHSKVQATVGEQLLQRNYEPSDQVIVDGQVVIAYSDSSDNPPNNNPTGGLILAARESYERHAHVRFAALLIVSAPTAAEKAAVGTQLAAEWGL